MITPRRSALVLAVSLVGEVAAQAARAQTTPAAPLAAIGATGAGALIPATSAIPASPATPATPAVTGRVLVEAPAVSRLAPLAAAGVYAYQLADLSLRKVLTDAQGNFSFPDLPAGLYKIIAHKPGFVPAVIMLTRTTARAYQFLELQLAQQDAAHPTLAAEDFWALRARIPADVLRDIETAELPGIGGAGLPGAQNPAGPSSGASPKKASAASGALASFHTEMQAMTGVSDVARLGSGPTSDAHLGIQGWVGDVQVGLKGRFWQMNGDAGGNSGWSRGDGKTSALSLDVAPGPGSRISVTSLNNRLVPRGLGGDSTDAAGAGAAGRPVGLEHYQVSWSQALGERGRSDFAAQYTNEFNYHRQSLIDPAGIPGASRTWNVEGAYTTSIGDESTLQSGLRFREQQFGITPASLGIPGIAGGSPAGVSGVSSAALAPGHTNLDVYSRGGTRVAPALLVEYGLYSTLLDGSVALRPQGGVVLQLGNGWQARGSLSRQVYQQGGLNGQFLPTLFKVTDLCEQGSKSCYELNLQRRRGDDDLITISGVEHIVGKTLRLYFSDEAFDRLESLYLVPGDRVPELRASVTRRLLPRVVTTLESSLASGGGGIFIAADRMPYKNEVRYVTTSLDTRFLATSTGVFVALRHMTQALAPAALAPATLAPAQRAQTQATPLNAATAPLASSATQIDRLQVMLTQDLNVLFSLASAWALQLNMEVSRGDLPVLGGSDNQLHRRILGGIAVKF